MPPRFTAVCSEIGRGHPQYLDSVLAALARAGVSDIPRVVPRWPLARLGYRLGARGGLLTALYTRARSDTPSRALLRLLDERLRRRFRGYPGTVLVDHPLLAHLLGPVCQVGYVHGEIAAPRLAAVRSARRILVPLEPTADALAAQGVARDALTVCGLFIEPGLAETAAAAFPARLARLSSAEPLTIGFFTSGAYPRPHLRLILSGIRSCLAAGFRARLFCGPDPRIERWFRLRLGAAPGLACLSARTREQENRQARALFPSLDLAVGPAHERTNWAVGLGLPLFLLEPDIGPFAPLNRAFALRAGVALPLRGPAEARALGPTLKRLRARGRLAALAEAGRDRYPLTGAETATRILLAARR